VRVWIVNHFGLPPTGSGPNRHHAMARALLAQGHEPVVVASGFEHYERTSRMPEGARFATEVVDDVTYLWVRTPGYDGLGGRARNIATFAARVATGARRLPTPVPDVIIGSSPHLLAPLGAFVAAKRLRVPFVMEVRDVWPESMVELLGMPSWHPAVVGFGVIERFLYRRSDHVLTVLPLAADHIVARGGAAQRVTWIPNGIDLARVPPARPQPSTPPFVVMYAGTLGLVNGLDGVLDAAAILQQRSRTDLRIRLIGPGPARERLAARVRDEGLGLVSIEPPVPKAEVHDVLAQAHVFLMVLEDSPVFRHGISPNKLYDYLAAERPVLFSVRTPYDPVTEAGAGVAVEPGDPASMADGIEQLAALGPEERAEMGRRGAAWVARSDYAVLGRQLAEVLESVVAGWRDRRGGL
jgi:glycosyltransferase involved in cell wall biosynthesis